MFSGNAKVYIKIINDVDTLYLQHALVEWAHES